MMFAKRLIAGGLAAGWILGQASAGLAATEPQPGIYSLYQYVVSSSSSPAGLDCNAVGSTLGGHFMWPGPSKTGAYTTGAIEDDAAKTMKMQVCTFPTTPASGDTTWSGTEKCTNTYMTGPPSNYTETFSFKFTYVNTNTFLGKRTLTYPTAGGTCTEVRDTGIERTGK